MLLLFKTDNGESVSIDSDSIVMIEQYKKTESLINTAEDRVINVLGSVEDLTNYVNKNIQSLLSV